MKSSRSEPPARSDVLNGLLAAHMEFIHVLLLTVASLGPALVILPDTSRCRLRHHIIAVNLVDPFLLGY